MSEVDGQEREGVELGSVAVGLVVVEMANRTDRIRGRVKGRRNQSLPESTPNRTRMPKTGRPREDRKSTATGRSRLR